VGHYGVSRYGSKIAALGLEGRNELNRLALAGPPSIGHRASRSSHPLWLALGAPGSLIASGCSYGLGVRPQQLSTQSPVGGFGRISGFGLAQTRGRSEVEVRRTSNSGHPRARSQCPPCAMSRYYQSRCRSHFCCPSKQERMKDASASCRLSSGIT
jgi:hypothetical protein